MTVKKQSTLLLTSSGWWKDLIPQYMKWLTGMENYNWYSV